MLERRHSKESFVQTTTDAISNYETQHASLLKQKNEQAAIAGEQSKVFESNKQMVSADSNENSAVVRGCEQSVVDFQREQEDSAREAQALGQAVKVLEGKFGEVSEDEKAAALLQLARSSKLFGAKSSLKLATVAMKASIKLVKSDELPTELKKEISQKERLSELLRHLSNTNGDQKLSFGLLQAANMMEEGSAAMKKQGLDKVRDLIAQLITKLENEMQEEASKQDHCMVELEESKHKTDTTGSSAKEHEAKANQRINELATLRREVVELTKAIAESDTAQARALSQRQVESAQNLATEKDTNEAVTALNDAVSVLSEFYDSAAPTLYKHQGGVETTTKGIQQFRDEKTVNTLNGDETTLLQTRSGMKRESESAKLVMGFLTTAIEDFNQILRDTRAEERDQDRNYNEQKQAAAVAKASMEASKKSKATTTSQLEVVVAKDVEEGKRLAAAHVAAVDYANSVNAQCARKPMSYAEKKDKQEQELNGLREALNILAA